LTLRHWDVRYGHLRGRASRHLGRCLRCPWLGGWRSGRRCLPGFCLKADGIRFRFFENLVVIFLVLKEEIRNVEESISVQPDSHEGRLHSRKHPADTAFIDSSYQPDIRISLKIHFHQLVVFHDGQLRLVRRRRDIHLL
jgi:hypothetical protein